MISVSSSADFVLFTTEGCHLCDQAIGVVTAVLDLEKTTVELVDIAEEDNADQLIEAYGAKIPVIRHITSDSEIFWPFDINEFSGWIGRLKASL
jgi:hypothetical protein